MKKNKENNIYNYSVKNLEDDDYRICKADIELK